MHLENYSWYYDMRVKDNHPFFYSTIMCACFE